MDPHAVTRKAAYLRSRVSGLADEKKRSPLVFPFKKLQAKKNVI